MIKEIAPAELKARLAAPNPPVVLDVREGWERDVAALSGTVHIPINDVPARLSELDPDQELVVMCRSGGRSTQVARYLDAQGFKSVANLTGGILAWSRDVDPSVPTY